MKKILFLFVCCLLIWQYSNAQLGTHWKKIRHEVTFGVGTSNFMGELGGANQAGTYFVRDFEFKSTRPTFHLGYRYKLAESWAVKTGLFYGWVHGDDSFAAPKGDDAIHPENFRYNRNLSFRSPIVELSANIEYSIIKERYGHRYDLRRVKGKANKPNLYVFTGISAFYFNPKAVWPEEVGGDGEWHALQPLGTEGQGIVPTRDKYNRICVAIPAGFGLTYLLDRNWAVGFEYGFRYTFTDYIDDVSTTYVDPSIFDDPMAAYFSNPSINDWNGGATLNQRGDNRRNDIYMFLTLNVSYKIRPRYSGAPKF
jgi:hypothetical protein